MNYENPTKSNRTWVVEFSEPRCDDQRQAAALKQVGTTLLHQVIRKFVVAVMPDAEVVDANGTPVRTVRCVRRSDARKFVAAWGGRILARTSAEDSDSGD
jgi:hypothetical protein